MRSAEVTKSHYILRTMVNGDSHEMTLLTYVGKTGDGWLQFIDNTTKKNHLCPPDQFPRHEFKSFDSKIELVYE